MTGRSVRSATVESSNTIRFDFPYAGEQRATLAVRMHPRYGHDVILSIDSGQFMCGGYYGCDITARFDGGEPETFGALEPTDDRSTAIFVHADKPEFMRKLLTAKKLLIEAEFFQEGTRVLEFNFPVALRAEFAGASTAVRMVSRRTAASVL